MALAIGSLAREGVGTLSFWIQASREQDERDQKAEEAKSFLVLVKLFLGTTKCLCMLATKTIEKLLQEVQRTGIPKFHFRLLFQNRYLEVLISTGLLFALSFSS